MSVRPSPSTSASAGVVKLLSAWNHGNPGSMAPFPAFMACPTSPSEPATTSVEPARSPTAIEACTPLAGLASVEGFCTLVNHCEPPWGVKAAYPPADGLAALPSPTNTESRPPAPVTATDGVASTGTPPVLAGHPGTVAPEARLKA